MPAGIAVLTADELIRFQFGHLEQMRQHIEPMAVRQLSQIHDGSGNQVRGFERTSVS